MQRKKAKEERIDYFFECTLWDGTVRNAEPHKCDELKWANIDNLPDNTVDYIKEALNNYTKGICFSIYGWE
jgi:hypothetical protein